MAEVQLCKKSESVIRQTHRKHSYILHLVFYILPLCRGVFTSSIFKTERRAQADG